METEARELLQHVMQRRRKELEVRGGGPGALAGSLKEVLAKRNIGRRMQSRELSQLWRDCLDEPTAKKTRVVSLRNRILLVEVSDSVLMSELASFHKAMILRKLKQARPDMEIKNVKFRLNAALQ